MPPACDVLLTYGHVLTMDERFMACETGSVAIASGRISAVGAR